MMKIRNIPGVIHFANSTKEIDETAVRNFVFGKDGVFEVRKLGPFAVTTKAKNIPGFAEEEIKSGVTSTAKIPISLLVSILTFFAKVYEIHKTEAAALIVWNPEIKKFEVEIPEQEISGASARWSREYLSLPEYKKVPVMELHSHPWGNSASPSGIDDGDEVKQFGLFGVCGNIEQNINIRATNNGSELKLKLFDTFEPDVPEEWMSKLKTWSTTYPRIYKGGFASDLGSTHGFGWANWLDKYYAKGGKKCGFNVGKDKFAEEVESMQQPGDIVVGDEEPEEGILDFQYMKNNAIKTEAKAEMLLEDMAMLITAADEKRLKELYDLAQKWNVEDEDEFLGTPKEPTEN